MTSVHRAVLLAIALLFVCAPAAEATPGEDGGDPGEPPLGGNGLPCIWIDLTGPVPKVTPMTSC